VLSSAGHGPLYFSYLCIWSTKSVHIAFDGIIVHSIRSKEESIDVPADVTVEIIL
jgi:hypothetical protein